MDLHITSLFALVVSLGVLTKMQFLKLRHSLDHRCTHYGKHWAYLFIRSNRATSNLSFVYSEHCSFCFFKHTRFTLTKAKSKLTWQSFALRGLNATNFLFGVT